jgi:hypothetical protein
MHGQGVGGEPVVASPLNRMQVLCLNTDCVIQLFGKDGI